jgi:ActR/RegA family two-component response regulator
MMGGVVGEHAVTSRVALIGGDLMFRSRLSSALEARGVAVRSTKEGELPDAELVFVDLNASVEGRLGEIRRLREERLDVTIVGFCHHGEKAVRKAAMESGADQVVTNGAIAETALRLLGRDGRG